MRDLTVATLSELLEHHPTVEEATEYFTKCYGEIKRKKQ